MLNGDHLTVVAPAGGIGVVAGCGTSWSAAATFTNSIVTGGANAYRRNASSGSADLTFGFSDVDLSSGMDQGGTGSVRSGSGPARSCPRDHTETPGAWRSFVATTVAAPTGGGATTRALRARDRRAAQA